LHFTYIQFDNRQPQALKFCFCTREALGH
jgi:hypothetical protein